MPFLAEILPRANWPSFVVGQKHVFAHIIKPGTCDDKNTDATHSKAISGLELDRVPV